MVPKRWDFESVGSGQKNKMTRSGAVNQETRMVELEDHIRALWENAKKELRKEIKQSTIETRNVILKELRSMFGVGILDKGKGVAEESIEGAENSAISMGLHAVSLGGKGILPSTKGPGVVITKDHNSTRSIVDNGGMFKFMPKIKLVSFDGKEPRASLWKRIEYFEIYRIVREQRIVVASLFLMDRANSWYHN